MVGTYFYILFEKSNDIFLKFLVETFWKYFKNFPNFLFKIFQTIFFKNRLKTLGMPLYFFQICPRFVSPLLLILWIIIFETKQRFGRNPSKLFFIQNLKTIISPKLAEVSQPIYHLKCISFNSWKKFFLMCQNFFFSSLFNLYYFDFDV